ncbi:PAS domain-containing protein [Geitlerinema sp. PCC 9228]|uniref:PAS domain-containing protein n=1 Tax=Geitlerinema sp. PCC 9228 TaxID=111611 RepID=UPI0008F9BD24|nr:PAS domain-containing protein [Geitlerinema sp. PCC 9228]
MSEKRKSQASSSRLQKLAACFPGAIVQFCRSSGGNTKVSQLEGKCEMLFGEAATEVATHPERLWQFVHPEDQETFWQTLDVSAENLQPWSWQGRFVGAGGSSIWVEAYATPEATTAGEIWWDGILLKSDRASESLGGDTTNDISQGGEENLRTMFNQTFQLMGLLDAQGRVLEANDSALALLTASEKT